MCGRSHFSWRTGARWPSLFVRSGSASRSPSGPSRGSPCPSWERNRFRGVAGSDGTTHLLTPELRLSLNPRFEVSGIWQYNTAVEASSLNVRLSWEFRPLSFVYVVYNDNASHEGALDPFPARRQLIVKGTWLWQP